MSDNSVRAPASLEGGSRRYGDRLSCMETVFKADRCEGEGGGGGTILVRQKWSPSKSGGRRHADRPPSLETVFKVDVRERGDPPSKSGGRRQTDCQFSKLIRGSRRGGPYLSDKSDPPSKEYRHLEIAYQGG